jgi:predicted transcriptional regulator
MELHLTPEQEKRLSRIAQHEGKALEELATERVLSLLDDEDGFRAAVREGLAQADAGEFIEEEEMDRLFTRAAALRTH